MRPRKQPEKPRGKGERLHLTRFLLSGFLQELSIAGHASFILGETCKAMHA